MNYASEQDIGPAGRQDREQCILIAQIRAVAAQRHDLSKGEQGVAQFAADLAVLAQQ